MESSAVFIEREPINHEDKFAVAVKLEGRVVGHLPFNIAPTVLHFLNKPKQRNCGSYWKVN